jgi:hypothetical protein
MVLGTPGCTLSLLTVHIPIAIVMTISSSLALTPPSGIVLTHVLTHLIITFATQRGKWYYYPHFTDEGAKA